MKPWLVKEFSRYKLGNSEYKYNKNRDKRFKTEAKALKYFSEVDSGIGGDTSFRHEIEYKPEVINNLFLVNLGNTD